MANARQLPPARSAALQTLFLSLHRSMDIQAALDLVLKQNADSMDRRDTALATEISYGYLRMKGRIDYVLSQYLKNPSKLPDKFYLALGAAAYEILFLTKIPAYASVNWAVEFSKSYRRANLAGLFNAVLRKVARLVDDEEDSAVYTMDFYNDGSPETTVLARYYSCPEWIVQLWHDSYGREKTLQYLEAQANPPSIGICLNTEHEKYEELQEKLSSRKDCLAADGPHLAFPAFSDAVSGMPSKSFVRKSYASREALMQLKPATFGTPVWDACSGRGGKTSVLLEQGLSPVFASDVHEGRLRALRYENPEAYVFRARADRPAPLSRKMQTVLLDLPCSGLGVLSRRPDSKWKRAPRDLHNLEELQWRILGNAYEAVERGGKLCIVTCTLNPNENERLVERFAAEHPRALLEKVWTTPSDGSTGEFFFSARILKSK